MGAEPSELPAADVEERLGHARDRLLEVARELDPLPTWGHLRARLADVATEIHQIEEELLLLVHLEQMEYSGVMLELAGIDQRLADGWEPDGLPVDEFVSRLRKRLEDG